MSTRGVKLRSASRHVNSALKNGSAANRQCKKEERQGKEDERRKIRLAREEEQREAEEKKREEEEKNRQKMSKEIRAIKNHETYKYLTKKVEKLEKEMQDLYPEAYQKVEPKDKSNEKGDQMIKEVFTKGNNDIAKVLDARAERNKETDDCPADYYIATEKRDLGEKLLTTEILVKSKGYSRPTWQKSAQQKGRPVLEYKLRQSRLDFVEFVIRQLDGDTAFESNYPWRYLEAENGEGFGGYLTKHSPGQYKNKLRALEFSFNGTLKKYHLPPIFIEDWTNKMKGANDLRKLQFIQSSILTAEVKQLLKDNENGLGDAIRCGEACRASGANCDSKWHGNCCARNEMQEMIGDDKKPQFIQGHRTGEPCSVRFECTSACACDPKTCGNRIVQQGRKHPLLIFFHPVKGWTIRTLTEMGVWDLIGEYCGVVQTEPSKTKKARTYDVNLQFKVKKADGEMGRLYVAADKSENTLAH